MRLAAAILASIVLAGCAQPSAPATSEGKGPDWSFTAIDGATYSRDSPEANATVLFFMATWCGTCRTKAPVIAEVAADYANESVRVLSVDFDASETAEDLRAWQERYQQPWPHGIDRGLRTQRALDVRSQSTVVVLDADGNVVEHFGYGKVTGAGLREALDRALAA